MKKLTLSIAAVMAMSTFAIAGGDIAPVEEPMVEVVESVVDDSGFYLGLAYSLLTLKSTDTYNYSQGIPAIYTVDEDFNEIMIQAGYKFNEYVAIEGRYWFGLDKSFTGYYDDNSIYEYDVNIDAWGIYVKPMYPLTEAFDIYALLGYGNVKITDNSGIYHEQGGNFDESGFQWGLGASYAFTDNLSVFVDYVNLYDDTTTVAHEFFDIDYEDAIDTWNFGVTYKF